MTIVPFLLAGTVYIYIYIYIHIGRALHTRSQNENNIGHRFAINSVYSSSNNSNNSFGPSKYANIYPTSDISSFTTTNGCLHDRSIQSLTTQLSAQQSFLSSQPPFTKKVGSLLALDEHGHPCEYFESIFWSTSFNLITTQTNLYASQSNATWEETSSAEIKAFLGMLLAIGLIRHHFTLIIGAKIPYLVHQA